MKKRKYLFYFLSVLFVLGFPFLLLEGVLRFRHYPVKCYWQLYEHQRGEPRTTQPDQVLGWRPLPGSHRIRDIRTKNYYAYTLWPDGSRATRAVLETPQADKSIVFLGCSLTQGWGVPDQESFVWQLQERYPDFRLINLGVVGYSTYQSLLFLEEYLRHSKQKPAAVIYGFIDHHPARNVADPGWLFSLSQQARRLTVFLPYCLAEGSGELRCFPPAPYPRWPGDRLSYAVNFIKDCYFRGHWQTRDKHKKEVTKGLLARMRDLCRDHGTRLIVVNLQGYVYAWEYKEFLARSGIESFDCYNEALMSRPDMQVGDGHPGGPVHAFFAQCIERHLQDGNLLR